MIPRTVAERAARRALRMIRAARIVLREDEAGKVEVADFGLGHPDIEGAQILTFFCTERVSAKVIALFPGQSLPEHWHPSVGADPGKEETIRVIRGTVYAGLPGHGTKRHARFPAGKARFYSVRAERVLGPGDQVTLAPGVKHWLQAGPRGVVLYSFATCARDILDQFTDPSIERRTRIVQDAERMRKREH